MKTIISLNFVALALAGFLAWSLWGSLDSLSQARVELANLEGQSGKLVENKKLLSSLGDSQTKVEGYFVSSQTLPDLIEELENSATTTGVKFQLTRADVAAQDSKLNLDLSFSGPFNQVMNYAALLEAMPRQMVFNSLSLDKDLAGGKDWQVQASLTLLNYRDEKK